jgi:regulatory protein
VESQPEPAAGREAPGSSDGVSVEAGAAAASLTRALKAYALAQLAQRECSRAELRRKLLVRAGSTTSPNARRRSADALQHATTAHSPPRAPEHDDAQVVDPTLVESVLDWLEAHRYLSPERFIESRVRVRAARFGNLRIRQELAQHGLALTDEAQSALEGSEFERAQAVWSRKFAAGSGSRSDAAKQARFLAGRGFSTEVIRRVLRGSKPTE